MDIQIVIAIIGFSSAILVALIARSNGKAEPTNPSISVSSGRDSIVSGRDTIVNTKTNLVEEFFDEQALTLISIAANEILLDFGERTHWSSFDAKYLSEGLFMSARGPAFDNSKVENYRHPRFSDTLLAGAKVYARACQLAEEGGTISEQSRKRLDVVMQIYAGNHQAAAESSQSGPEEIAPGLYLDLDDDRAIQKAKKLSAYRALDIAGARGGIAAVMKEESTPSGIDLHVFINFTDQIASDNGFVHILATEVDQHPERKNQIWLLLQEYDLNPNEVLPLN
tara:strand:- start:178 stop:1023 length:846 start_codon:yes stop_codon:yes gene_type:complete